MIRKALSLILLTLTFTAAGVVLSHRLHRCSPYTLLGFRPVMKGSDETAVKAAQAELCRHQIDIGIDGVDGKCGKETALGICELLCKFDGTNLVEAEK